MWIRLITTLLCLFTLFAELAFDSSTSFVRMSPASTAGRLVVQKKQMPDAQAQALQGQAPHDYDDDNANDLLEFGTSSSHAGQVVSPVTLDVQIPVARLNPVIEVSYVDPALSDLQRPPSV